MTGALATATYVRHKWMIRWSALNPSREMQVTSAPWEYNAVLDNGVGLLAYAIILNVTDEKASKSRLRITGAAPGVEGSHFVFPPDCFGRSYSGGAFDVRDRVNGNGRKSTCAGLVTERKQSECEWSNGNTSNASRWAPGCPVRMAFGGVGGGHFLGITPVPVQWSAWADMVDDHRNVRGLMLEFVGARCDAGVRLGERAKPLSPGGEMQVISSNSGNRVVLLAPTSLSDTVKKRESASSAGEVKGGES